MANNNTNHTLFDADHLYKVAWTYINTVVDTVREPFLVLDQKLRVISANSTFYAVFQVTEKETKGKVIFDLGNGQWKINKLKILLEDIIPKNTYFTDFRVDLTSPKIGKKIIILNARQIYVPNEEKPIILLAMEDVTRQKQLEDELRQYIKEFTAKSKSHTAKLEKRITELERFNRTMADRILKLTALIKIKQAPKPTPVKKLKKQ